MAIGVKTGGRQRGTPNRLTAVVREAIEDAAEQIGGTARLVEWIKADPANERIFWGTIYPKLLPLQLDGTISHVNYDVAVMELLNGSTTATRDAASPQQITH